MRARILFGLVLSASVARAAPGTPPAGGPTSQAAEVVRVPPAPEPVRGPRFCPITIDLWIAFGHNQSAAMARVARRVVERAPDAREVVHLTAGWGLPGADLAAEAALEAESEGHFFEFLDRVLREGATPSPAELVRLGRDAGLDGDRLEQALESRVWRAEVTRRSQEARALGHVPGELTINGRRSYSVEDVPPRVLAQERDRARDLLDAGVPLSRIYERLMEDHERERLGEEAQRSANRPRRFVDVAGSPARGPSLAPVTLVVFANFACGGCAELLTQVRRLRDAHPGALRVVWKHCYSPYSGNAYEREAIELAAAAALQNRFWELHDAWLDRGGPPPGQLIAVAQAAGVDLSRVARDRKADLPHAVWERDLSELRRVGLPPAPLVLVNGYAFIAGTPYEKLERAVQDELARGVLDRLHPSP